jgi:hypothetical protein
MKFANGPDILKFVELYCDFYKYAKIYVNVKGKVAPVLFLTEHHAMMAY